MSQWATASCVCQKEGQWEVVVHAENKRWEKGSSVVLSVYSVAQNGIMPPVQTGESSSRENQSLKSSSAWLRAALQGVWPLHTTQRKVHLSPCTGGKKHQHIELKDGASLGERWLPFTVVANKWGRFHIRNFRGKETWKANMQVCSLYTQFNVKKVNSAVYVEFLLKLLDCIWI